MMQKIELKCQYINHDEKEICGVCIRNICDKLRPGCFMCMKEYRQDHLNDFIDIDQFNQSKVESENFYNVVLEVLDKISQVDQLARYMIKQIPPNQNLQYLTLEQLNIQAIQTIKLNSIKSLIGKDFLQLRQQLAEIKKKFEQCIHQESQQQKHKIVIVEQVQAIQISEQPSFTFSKQAKSEGVKVSDKGNWIQESECDWGFCICEPEVPKNMVIRIVFKINSLYHAYIGVCQKDLVSLVKYDLDVSNIGHGSYLIDNNGYTYSHHQAEINHKPNSFKFKTDDIIIVEIDIKNNMVTWRKKQTNNVYTINLNCEGGYSFCIALVDSSITIIKD